MKIPKIVTLLIFLFISINNLYGQVAVYSIKGQVIGEQEKKLVAASVSLLDKENKEVLKTLTDSNGHFYLPYSSKEDYTLVISYTGYKEYRSEVFQPTNKNFGTIKLITIAGTLNEVVIKSKQKLIELDGSSIVYNVSKSIDAQGTSAFEALKKAPGVTINNDNAISLNGKQGILIMIDGRQTYLSGNEMIDLLKSMPSSGIRSIEIINSPGAKYDAAGSAGIINIKTIKSQIKGFNGTTTTGISYGLNTRQNQDIAFNYRKSKYNIYGSYNHFLGYSTYIYGSDRVQNRKTYNSDTDDTDKRQKMGARFGIDYTINKKHTAGILMNSNFIFGGGITLTGTDIDSVISSPDVQKALDASNDYYYQQTDRYTINLNYKYEDTLGTIINLDADYGFFNKGNKNLQSNININNENAILSQSLYRSLNGIDINLKALKFDYTTNFWKGKLETGSKYSDIIADNDFQFFDATSGQDIRNERRSNTFQFNEQVASAYASYKRTLSKWTLQAGVRLENTSSNGTLVFKFNGIDSIKSIPKSYTNIFPSFSVSVKPKDNHSFSLGYSRRIDRPAYQDLNPFVYLLDELSYWQGNPFLQPQLTHRGSLLYAFKNSTILAITFAHTDQYSTRITDTIENDKIVFIPKNLGIQKNLSFSLTQNSSPAKWWDITFNGVIYHIHNKVSFDQYRNFDLQQWAGKVNLQQTFKFPYKITGEVTASFNTKRLSAANEISRGTSQIDLGIQKIILKDKATIRLVLSDIYLGNTYNSLQQYEGFQLRTYGRGESRQVRLNFTYKFADNSVKGPRSRNSALENENGRIK